MGGRLGASTGSAGYQQGQRRTERATGHVVARSVDGVDVRHRQQEVQREASLAAARWESVLHAQHVGQLPVELVHHRLRLGDVIALSTAGAVHVASLMLVI